MKLGGMLKKRTKMETIWPRDGEKLDDVKKIKWARRNGK
jgi:hypothetical protein